MPEDGGPGWSLGWATGENLTAVAHVTMTVHGEPSCGLFLSVWEILVKALTSENRSDSFHRGNGR